MERDNARVLHIPLRTFSLLRLGYISSIYDEPWATVGFFLVTALIRRVAETLLNAVS